MNQRVPEKFNRSQPIGVFDSGIGGLTVVRALRELLPNETICYLGDTARVPYGGKSAATVERYSLQLTEMLLAQDCKTIVVACNTASALALPRLEEESPVPVLGVIRPGAGAALSATRNGHIGVIGTRATIRSGAYERAIQALDPAVHVSTRACPLFVPLIEEGWLEGEITERIVRQYLQPLVEDGIDTLVLGCTHYPLLRATIGRVLGEKIQLVDSAQNCAAAVSRLLEAEDLRTASTTGGGLSVALTDPPDAFLEVARKALHLDIGTVELRQVIHPAGGTGAVPSASGRPLT
ncbi:MAG: glutamate racemase [Spartobacteria bacterium]